MNAIKQKIVNLTNQFTNYRKQLKSNGTSEAEIETLSREYITDNLQLELDNIRNECEGLGHSIALISNDNGVILSNNKTTIQFCVNCGKTWDNE